MVIFVILRLWTLIIQLAVECKWLAALRAILMDGPDDYTIDLTGLAPIPGFDCVITASADGVFDDLDPDDIDGSLTIGITSVQASPGGTCNLNPPSGDCELGIGMDADPL